MKIVSWEKAPSAPHWVEYIAIVRHDPSWLGRILFGCTPEEVAYRGRACWWHRADTGEMITAGRAFDRDFAAKQMLTNAFTRMEWAALDNKPANIGQRTR